MAKHESAAVHVTQQVVARLPNSEWVCHQPQLGLHPPECLAALDRGFLPVFFSNRVQWSDRTYFLLILMSPREGWKRDNPVGSLFLLSLTFWTSFLLVHTSLTWRSPNVYETKSNTLMSAKVLLKRLFNLLYLNVHNLKLVHTCSTPKSNSRFPLFGEYWRVP